MANWSLPTIADLYSNIIAYLGNRLNDAALWFDSGLTSPTNHPTGTKRWNSTSNKFEKWSGSAWADLAATYAISISGNAATATSAATCTGNAATATTAATCTGNAATATTAAACTGNAATATTAERLSGTPVLGYSVSGQTVAYTAQGGPMVNNAGSGAAMLTLHRAGSYAVNFGLDTDNKLKWGGWSKGAVSYEIIDSNNIGSYAVVSSACFGIGQTLQDVTSSRISGTTYTNSTGKPIWVSCWFSANFTQSAECTITVNGVILVGGTVSTVGQSQVCCMIAPGSTYAFTLNSHATKQKIIEFR